MASRRQGPRRQTTWFDQMFNSDVATGLQALQRLTPSGENLEGFTAIRLLLTLILHPSTPAAVSGSQRVDFGIGVSSEEAFTLGVNALPNAEVETEFPERGWLLRDSQMVTDEAGGFLPLRLTYDLRSQRKIENGVLYFIATSTPIEGTTFNVRMLGIARVLCLRP